MIQTVHLSVANNTVPKIVRAVQNDTDRSLQMILDDMTLTSGLTGLLTFRRADGTYYQAAATLDTATNSFTAELDQALTCAGKTLCQLKVTATDTVSTFTFVVWVEADTSGTLSPQEGISLSEAVQRAESAADRAEEAAESWGGLTDNIKNALLQIARKVAYIDEHGQDYYDDLYDALYEVTGLTLDVTSISLGTIGATSQITATTVPSGAAVTWVSSDTSVATVNNGLVTAVGYGSATITASAGNLTAQCSVLIAQATVTSISAVYTPSGTIYETNIPSLDTLKNDLVVTAQWSNGTTSTVTDYALSGTLSVGSNTVTVSYGGQTTTITVTVIALSSISAVYTQSGTVYDTASLDDLKADLVVNVNFADSTTQTVTGYTLSGTLAEGTSIITVSYGGKTATFTVTVTEAPLDTTVQLDTEYMNKGQSGTVGNYSNKIGFCPSISYPVATTLSSGYDYLCGIIPVDEVASHTCKAWLYYQDNNAEAYTGNGSGKPMQVYSESMTQGRIGFQVSLNVVSFTIPVHVDYLDDSYIYIQSTGNVLFAGKNTPYYGMHNISEANA